MLLSTEKTHDLLPQKKPFILVDHLINCGVDFCTSSFKIPQDHVLVENDIVTTGLLIENIAQTAALHLGYTYQQKQMESPTGFIAEIKNLNIFHLPKINDVLTTKIKIETEVFNCIIVSGQICIEGQNIADCNLKVFLNIPNA